VRARPLPRDERTKHFAYAPAGLLRKEIVAVSPAHRAEGPHRRPRAIAARTASLGLVERQRPLARRYAWGCAEKPKGFSLLTYSCGQLSPLSALAKLAILAAVSFADVLATTSGWIPAAFDPQALPRVPRYIEAPGQHDPSYVNLRGPKGSADHHAGDAGRRCNGARGQGTGCDSPLSWPGRLSAPAGEHGRQPIELSSSAISVSPQMKRWQSLMSSMG